MYAMIRQIKNVGRDYIIVDNSLKVKDTTVPFHLQINITGLTQEEVNQVYKIVHVAFNRNIDFNIKPKQQPKKPWYRFW
jgi:hypothetical protein